MIFETHGHYDDTQFDKDREQLIVEFLEKDIDKVMNVGADMQSSRNSVELAAKYPHFYAAVGVHPSEVGELTETDIQELKSMVLDNPKVRAIGEIGLDYHYGTDKEKQKKLFKEQLKIAQRLNLPVVIHSRDATKDTIDILKMFNVSGVIHCFSGSLETANIYISMGYKLGIGGVLTFKNSKLYRVIENINLENIVLETDSPYLTPEPYRGKTNSSKYIPIIAKKLAEIKKVSIEEVAKITTNNAYLIFDLK